MSIMNCFPAGGGGGGGELNITAYSTVGNLPASTDEGAVAVITSTAINDVYVSLDAPNSPSSGDVWIFLGSNSIVDIDIGNDILLPARAVYQYISSAWVLLESYVYTNSAWEDITMLVYYAGDFYLSSGISLVALVNDGQYCTYSIEAASINLQAYQTNANAIADYIVLGFDTPIDLTDIDSVTCVVTVTNVNGGTFYLAVSPDKSNTFSAYTARSSNGSAVTMTVDVSALSGEYYIMLKAYIPTGSNQRVNASVTEVAIER